MNVATAGKRQHYCRKSVSTSLGVPTFEMRVDTIGGLLPAIVPGMPTA